MKNGYWVIRTYRAGAVVEKTKYWLPGEKPVRGKRKIKTEIKKQEQNDKHAERRLARVLNANYSGGDYLIGLDYDEKNYKRLFGQCKTREEILEAAEHQAQLCLRRVKREAEKAGVEVKAVIVTSDMDGKSGQEIRVHHHVVVNKEAAEFFKLKWRKNMFVDMKALETQKDYTPLAHYLVAQVYRRVNARAYTCTRNLVHPEGKDRIAISGARMSAPSGAEVLFVSEFAPGINQYIRYYEPSRAIKTDTLKDKESRAGND